MQHTCITVALCRPKNNKKLQGANATANESTLRLSCTYPGLGGGGPTPGTYAGMARDWSSLFFNFKPGMGRLDCFSTFVAASLVEDPRDL